MYRATVIVTLRRSILDPQGKAVRHAASNLGMAAIQDVRIGKQVEITLQAADRVEAERITLEACRKLLANPVMEDYTFTVDEIR